MVITNETILILLLVLLIAAALPTWPHSQSWGYGPTGLLTVVLIVLIAWVLCGGRIPGSGTSANVRSDINSAGQSVKQAGRDGADSLRRIVNQ